MSLTCNETRNPHGFGCALGGLGDGVSGASGGLGGGGSGHSHAAPRFVGHRGFMSPARRSSTLSRPSRRTSAPTWWQRALPVVVIVALMWVSEIFDQITPGSLDQYGVQPREVDHLGGIVLMPFLHGGYEHLAANSSALLVLGALLAWTTRHLWIVSAGVVLLGGLGVWLTGAPNTVHIGASGLVYGYAAFLAVYGFVARKFASALVGILVIVVYGSMVWGVLPTQAGVSWQGHLFGAVAGGVLALWLGRRARRRGLNAATFI